MSFESILTDLLDGVSGAIGAALMGNDGIPIAQIQAPGPFAGVLGEDVSTAGAEFGRLLEEIRKGADALQGGELSETLITTARFVLLFRAVDEDVFLVLAFRPTGNVGKARYLVRRHLEALREQL